MSNQIDFEVLFERSPAPTMILNKDLEFVAANKAYLDMVRRSWEQIKGCYVFDAFPETQERVEGMLALFRATLAGEDTTLAELPFRITVDGVSKEEFWTVHHACLKSDAEGEPYLLQFSENVTGQVKMREMRNAMLGELQHRIGNVFSIVFALARQVARQATSVQDFLSMLEDRLMSLVSLNKQLTGASPSQAETIASVIDHQLAVHGADALKRVSIAGPEYTLSMHQCQAVSMAIHELATNSLKYGSIRQSKGQVSIEWSMLPAGGCLFVWEETGIAVDATAEKTGYGTMLLTTIVPSQLNGRASRELGPTFFRYSLEFGPASDNI